LDEPVSRSEKISLEQVRLLKGIVEKFLGLFQSLGHGRVLFYSVIRPDRQIYV